jgi:hypothetical protein
MIIDKELEFADGTWAPTATGDNISPNVWDSGPLSGTPTANTGRDFGQGEGFWLMVLVVTAVTSGGAATVDFRLRTSANSNLTSSPTDLVSTGAIAKATLVAGYQSFLKFPSINSQAYLRYLGVNANIGTAVLTAGAFRCDAIKDVQKNVKYAGSFGLDV